MKKTKPLFVRALMFTAVAVLLAADGRAAATKPDATGRARYVFLLIGDGMGPGQRLLADRYVRGSAPGAPGLTMNSLVVTGSVDTSNSGGGTTDSAAAATAIACGVKTKNGALGVAPDGARFRSLAADAAARGMSVGILSDVPANHATPAGFYAVSDSRSSYSEIAMQWPPTGYDFLAGSGIQWELARPAVSDFYAAATKAGYAIAVGAEGLAALPAGGKAVAVWSRNESEMAPYIDACAGIRPERAGEMAISRFVAAAIKRLSGNPRGFFIMAEGGRIDKMCHVNDSSATVMETLVFDAVVRQALAFREAHPADTLVVVTADHETGGLGVDAGRATNAELFRILSARKSSVAGLVKTVNTARKARVSFDGAVTALSPSVDMTVLPADALAALRKAWDGGGGAAAGTDGMSGGDYGSPAGFAARVVAAFDGAAGISWKSRDHTPVNVPLTAVGVGAETFTGEFPNTGIHDRLLALLPALAKADEPAAK